MYVQELWRYPVKSMRGERISQAEVAKTGIRGDRNIVVVSETRERVITARTHPGLLGLQAIVSPDGETMIEGRPWHSLEALALTCRAAGEPVRLVDAGLHVERFDVLPLLIATDGQLSGCFLDLIKILRRSDGARLTILATAHANRNCTTRGEHA